MLHAKRELKYTKVFELDNYLNVKDDLSNFLANSTKVCCTFYGVGWEKGCKGQSMDNLLSKKPVSQIP